MNYVQLTNIDVAASTIAMGSALFGSRVSQEDSFRCLDTYAEHGGTIIDTANKYAAWFDDCIGGESERVIGEWLKRRNAYGNVIVMTKAGYSYGDIPTGLTKDIILGECEKSLKNLGVECLDIMLAHCDDRQTPQDETLAAFDTLIKQGKIKTCGCSNTRAWRLAQALEISRHQGIHSYRCIEQKASYLQPEFQEGFGDQPALNDDLLDCCRENGTTLFAYSPLLQGIYGKEEMPLPAGYRTQANIARLKTIRALAAEKNTSPNILALAWLLHQSPMCIPIIGSSNPDNIVHNMAAADIHLTAEDMNRLKTAGDMPATE